MTQVATLALTSVLKVTLLEWKIIMSWNKEGERWKKGNVANPT